jgi:hypothetical protein
VAWGVLLVGQGLIPAGLAGESLRILVSSRGFQSASSSRCSLLGLCTFTSDPLGLADGAAARKAIRKESFMNPGHELTVRGTAPIFFFLVMSFLPVSNYMHVTFCCFQSRSYLSTICIMRKYHLSYI